MRDGMLRKPLREHVGADIVAVLEDRAKNLAMSCVAKLSPVDLFCHPVDRAGPVEQDPQQFPLRLPPSLPERIEARGTTGLTRRLRWARLRLPRPGGANPLPKPEFLLQRFLRDARDLGSPGNIYPESDRIRGCPDGRQQAIERGTLAPQITEPVSTLQQLQLALEDIDGARELCFQLLSPVFRDIGVGIIAGRKGDDADFYTLTEENIAGAECRLETRFVRIVEQEHVAGVLSN